jgi:phosphoribosylaminoimidazole-succinocarboxamide synthase
MADINTPPRKVAEGKTKVIWALSGTEVMIESKDSISAGDGAKRDTLEGKAAFSTATNANVMRFLGRKGIPTHFIEQVGATKFKALRVDMIPLEIVARRVAYGSYTKRNPSIAPGTRFEHIVTELFYKDDDLHDPLVIPNTSTGLFELYDAKEHEVAIGELSDTVVKATPSVAEALRHTVEKVFLLLEEAWAQQGATLVDLKIECGYTIDMNLVVADVIDNDSWRVWVNGDSDQMVDKQVYRDLPGFSKEDAAAVAANYEWVAEATGKF